MSTLFQSRRINVTVMKNKTQKANETEHHDGRVDTNDQIQLFFGGGGGMDWEIFYLIRHMESWIVDI